MLYRYVCCKIILLMCITLVFNSCSQGILEGKDFGIDRYSNVLNIRNVPTGAVDWDSFCFSDLGSWFGYALPDTAKPASLGSFPGPFLMTNGKWLSNGLSKIKIYDRIHNSHLYLNSADEILLNYYPNKLNQIYKFENMDIQLNLIFSSKYTAIITLDIFNHSSKDLNINLEWVGQIFDTQIKLKIENGKLIYNLIDDGMKFYMFYNEGKAEVDNSSYSIVTENIIIKSGNSYNNAIFHSLDYKDKDFTQELDSIQFGFKNINRIFEKNNLRWQSYLDHGLETNSIWSKNTSYTKIAVKCIETLNSNWKAGIGALKNEGVIPSYAVWYFNGFWAWDSWKHAVGVVKFNPTLAKNQMRVMFTVQDEYGMIPDVIYADSTEDNWRNTKPPLAAWAVWKIFEEINDTSFLIEMYPKLVSYHNWWYEYRDHDGNGLCEYGGTDSALVTAMWESGMDDAVRFDNAKMLKNKENAWSINQESVDLNSYLYAEKKYLFNIAKLLNEDYDADKFLNDASVLKKRINEMMFDEKNGFYYDINVIDKSFVVTQGTEGWIPLWAKVAEDGQAEQVKQVMCDSAKFNTYLPFPTVSADDPKYMSGYWRGPVWLDQAYFAIEGMKNYGYKDEANKFVKHLFDRLDGLKDSDLPIRENYDPRNGGGLKVNHFSWSAAHLLLLYLDNQQ